MYHGIFIAFTLGNDITTACGLDKGKCKNVIFPTPDGMVHPFLDGYSFGNTSEWSTAASMISLGYNLLFEVVKCSFKDALYCTVRAQLIFSFLIFCVSFKVFHTFDTLVYHSKYANNYQILIFCQYLSNY